MAETPALTPVEVMNVAYFKHLATDSSTERCPNAIRAALRALAEIVPTVKSMEAGRDAQRKCRSEGYTEEGAFLVGCQALLLATAAEGKSK